MDLVQFNMKSRKVGAVIMCRLDDCELPYTLFCPNCTGFLLKVLTPAHGTARMNCAECGKLVQVTFAGK